MSFASMCLYTVSGTEEGSLTRAGSDCVLFAHSHVAHNCVLGNNVTMRHAVTIAGHVTIGNDVYLGESTGVKQFCRVGNVAMIEANARVIQDVLPFTIGDGMPAHMRVINRVGMERAGYSSDTIRVIRQVFRTLFVEGFRLEEAIEEVRNQFHTPSGQTKLG